MLDALKKAEKDVTRALIARELVKLPKTPSRWRASRKRSRRFSDRSQRSPGHERPADAGRGGRPVLQLGPGRLAARARGKKTKGSGDDLKALQGAIVVTAIKLAKVDQLEKVKAAVDNKHAPSWRRTCTRRPRSW